MVFIFQWVRLVDQLRRGTANSYSFVIPKTISRTMLYTISHNTLTTTYAARIIKPTLLFAQAPR
jgi:hypothetical protein